LKNITFAQVALGSAHSNGEEAKARYIKAVGEEVTMLALAGKIQVPLIREISMAEVPETLHSMLGANTTGKIVLKL
jgi:NADPH2:quinone reductase